MHFKENVSLFTEAGFQDNYPTANLRKAVWPHHSKEYLSSSPGDNEPPGLSFRVDRLEGNML